MRTQKDGKHSTDNNKISTLLNNASNSLAVVVYDVFLIKCLVVTLFFKKQPVSTNKRHKIALLPTDPIG